jgi:hypothetical protein
MLYNILINNRIKAGYRRETTREIIQWKVGGWRLKRVRRNSEQGICPACSTEEALSHKMKLKEQRFEAARFLDNNFGIIHAVLVLS